MSVCLSAWMDWCIYLCEKSCYLSIIYWAFIKSLYVKCHFVWCSLNQPTNQPTLSLSPTLITFLLASFFICNFLNENPQIPFPYVLISVSLTLPCSKPLTHCLRPNLQLPFISMSPRLHLFLTSAVLFSKVFRG